MKKVKKFGFGGALKGVGAVVKKAAAQVPANTAQTSKPGTPPTKTPKGMPSFAKPYVDAMMAKANNNAGTISKKPSKFAPFTKIPNYTGPGAGPTGPANMAKINQVKGMLQGKPMKKGGDVKHSDVKMDKKVVKKAVGMHEKQLHGGKKSDMSKLKSGGMACAPKKMAKGGGIEVRGKTKGTMVKMKRGGSC